MPRSATSAARLAYGVDPRRPERYSLRQARYQALAEEVSRRAVDLAPFGRPLRLLDVGLGRGVSMRYLEAHPGTPLIEYHGVDLRFDPQLYQPQRWRLYRGDLREGLALLSSDSFDCVVCEQVLEHLDEVQAAIAALARVLRPGGLLIVGVPIFPPGLHLARRHVVGLIDRLREPRKDGGHVQSFSKASFLRQLRSAAPGLLVQQVRGFRIVSGGVLRPLENWRWWWRLNRRLGSAVPSLCTEIQVLATKRGADRQSPPVPTRWRAAQAVPRNDSAAEFRETDGLGERTIDGARR